MNPKLTYNEILALIDAIDPVVYAKTRNHLNGAVTRLSPYITRGVISLPVIRDRVLAKYSKEAASKFIQELAWREYFQKVFAARGNEIFSDLRFPRSDFKHQQLVKVVVIGQTSITAVDESLKTLFETGYMHNHARMWTAMISCNIGKAYFYNMSRFLYYHLLDGDLASNTLSWQWVAGTSVNKQYLVNQELINACSGTSDQNTFLSAPAETLGQGDIPDLLQPKMPFTYKMEYPQCEPFPSLSGKTVFLYHPFSIDPLWHEGEEGIRILIIEPRLFDVHPISPLVYKHLETLARTHIPDLVIYIGNVETLPDVNMTTNVYSKSHPTTDHFPGTKELVAELFPGVTGYYPSFFKFWQACLETLK